MGQGYTRNDVSNNIANGNVINAADLDGEFDAIESAFAAATGHTHDGTDTEGGVITVIGPVQDFVASATALSPKTTGTYDLGTTTLRYDVAYLNSINLTGNITFGDNGKAIFGAGSDLQIYHDGSHSYVSDQGTGNIKILADDFVLKNAADTETMIQAFTDASVSLWCDNAAKLTTTSTGIDVTGTVTADGLTVDGDATISSASPTLNLTDTGGVGTATINANLSNVYYTTPSSSRGHYFKTNAGSNDVLSITGDGDISFYEDTGTTAKFFWDASAESLGIGTDSPTSVLHVSSSNPIIRLTDSDGSGITANPNMQFYGGATRLGYLGYAGSTESDFYIHNEQSANIRFITDTTEAMRIDSSGNVGIGTSSPATDGYVNLETVKNIRMDMGAVGADPALYFDHDNFSANTNNYISVKRTSESMAFQVAGSEAMRIDSSGNLYVSKTSGGSNVQGAEIRSTGQFVSTVDGSWAGLFNRETSDGEIIRIKKDDVTVGSIGVNGSRPYFTHPTYGGLRVDDYRVNPATTAGANWDNSLDLGAGGTRWKDLYLSGGVSNPSGDLTFDTTVGEAMRIDSSGNLLVGKTATDLTADGIELRGASEAITVTTGSNISMYLNRRTTDGDIVQFRKDNTTVGSIASRAGLVSTFILDPRSGGAGISAGGPVLYPTNESGSLTNGNMDFGAASYRWKDLYLSGNVVVSGTVDGRDVATDGTKLDGIEPGATGDQTAAEIRTLVEAATDSNVFTDADHTKLNGIATNANNYSHPTHPGDDFSVDTGALTGATVVSDIDINVTTDTLGHVTDANGSVSTRTLTLADLGYTGATNANYITNNNQLTNGAGYSTYSANQALDTTSTATFSKVRITSTTDASVSSTDHGLQIGLDSGDNIVIDGNEIQARNNGATDTLFIQNDGGNASFGGDITADGNVTAFSDETLKKDIVTIDGALDKVSAMRGVMYTRKSDDRACTGVIAQEVEKVLPEVVLMNDNGLRSVDYGNMVGLLIEAVKELKAEVEELKKGK